MFSYITRHSYQFPILPPENAVERDFMRSFQEVMHVHHDKFAVKIHRHIRFIQDVLRDEQSVLALLRFMTLELFSGPITYYGAFMFYVFFGELVAITRVSEDIMFSSFKTILEDLHGVGEWTRDYFDSSRSTDIPQKLLYCLYALLSVLLKFKIESSTVDS